MIKKDIAKVNAQEQRYGSPSDFRCQCSNQCSNEEHRAQDAPEAAGAQSTLTPFVCPIAPDSAYIERLPNETLIEIFDHCNVMKTEIRQDHDIYPCSVLQRRTMVAITHTCFRWRTVARSTPILWNHIGHCLTAVRSGRQALLDIRPTSARPASYGWTN